MSGLEQSGICSTYVVVLLPLAKSLTALAPFSKVWWLGVVSLTNPPLSILLPNSMAAGGQAVLMMQRLCKSGYCSR